MLNYRFSVQTIFPFIRFFFLDANINTNTYFNLPADFSVETSILYTYLSYIRLITYLHFSKMSYRRDYLILLASLLPLIFFFFFYQLMTSGYLMSMHVCTYVCIYIFSGKESLFMALIIIYLIIKYLLN